MEEILVAVVSMILVFSLIPLYLWKRRQVSPSPPQEEEENQVPQRETIVRHSGTRRMRRRPAAGASSSSTPAPTVEENVDESDDEATEGAYNIARASKKKEKKRQEREAERQAEEATRESRVTKQDRYAEIRRRKDEEREAQELQLEEEAKARKAKEDEAATLEFEKWKGEFSIDSEGTTENELQDEGRGLLFDFVEYIKKHKCVPLEDLAAEFKLRTQDCINRITSLESMGVDATDFTVGGSNGWSVPVDYNEWAQKKRFRVGDSLLFVYNMKKDSVLQVTKDDYDDCNTAKPIQTFQDGYTDIVFYESGSHYYISGNHDYCLKNEKMAVTVLASRGSSNGASSSPLFICIRPFLWSLFALVLHIV